MIEPQEVTIDDRVFILSKLPAVEGREIITQYMPTALPKIGDYKSNEVVMLKLIKYAAVKLSEERTIQLSTRELINNHCSSWELLVKLEWAMLEYNCTFFQNGNLSNFFGNISQRLPEWISKILTDSLAQLSQTEKPPTTN